MKNAINFYFLNFSQTSAIQDWVQLRWLGNFRCHAGIQAWYKYWLQNSLLPNYMLIIIGDKPNHERNTLTIFYVKWAQINILWTKSNFSENFLTEVLLLKVIWFRNVFYFVSSISSEKRMKEFDVTAITQPDGTLFFLIQ